MSDALRSLESNLYKRKRLAIAILRQIEKEKGHNPALIKETLDKEGKEGLIKRAREILERESLEMKEIERAETKEIRLRKKKKLKKLKELI